MPAGRRPASRSEFRAFERTRGRPRRRVPRNRRLGGWGGTCALSAPPRQAGVPARVSRRAARSHGRRRRRVQPTAVAQGRGAGGAVEGSISSGEPGPDDDRRWRGCRHTPPPPPPPPPSVLDNCRPCWRKETRLEREQLSTSPGPRCLRHQATRHTPSRGRSSPRACRRRRHYLTTTSKAARGDGR